jgi:hypothetical protein
MVKGEIHIIDREDLLKALKMQKFEKVDKPIYNYTHLKPVEE